MWVDTASSLRTDRVTSADDGVGPGDGPDAVFGVDVLGPIDALVLISVADGHGTSLGDGAVAWDTLLGVKRFPQSIATRYQTGGETEILGVSEDGVSLLNRPDGSMGQLGPGPHSLKVFANGGASVFATGRYFQLVGLLGDTLIWGPPTELSWGHPAINSMSVAPDFLDVDVVSAGDNALNPGSNVDFAFDIDVTGPLDTLVLRSLVYINTDLPETREYIWDTIPANQLFPMSIGADPKYAVGYDTWVLGVAAGSGAFINNTDGSLPRIGGHFMGRVFASSDGGLLSTTYVFQLAGLIGDLTIWGPTVVVQR